MSWTDYSASGGCTASNDTYLHTQDTSAATTSFRIDFNGFQYDVQTVILPFPPPGPCEDDRPLTKDSWRCPECEHLHGRRHYKNWKDGPPYCPHCKTEFESWDEITFLEQDEIDRLNRERRWTRDD